MLLESNTLTYQTIKQPLLKAFITVLVIVALVSSVSEWFIQQTFVTISADASVINIAGRQRMLSQNISKNVLLLSNKKFVDNRSEAFDALKIAINQLVENNQQLFVDKRSPNTKENSFSINKNNIEIEMLYQMLQPSLNKIVTATNLILDNNELSKSSIFSDEQQSQINIILANEAKFLTTMDDIVAQYSRNTQNQVTNIRHINWLLYVIWLSALLLIGIYVLRPTIKRIAILFDKIKQDQQTLNSTNHQLNDTLSMLDKTQHELIDAEKRSLLTSAIGGIVHDINTPLGICVTSVSFLQERSQVIVDDLENKSLKSSELKSFLTQQHESTAIIQRNIERVNELITRFKQIAVDQGSEQKRIINLNDYIYDIISALGPKLKHSQHKILVNCAENIQLDTYPSAFYQIFTNLIMNSIIHGFEENQSGIITINVENIKDEKILITYHDNGKGFGKEIEERIFEAFFTTRKNQGGSGLGTEIIHKLVTKDLQGKISCKSVIGEGTSFIIEIPKALKDDSSSND